MDEIRCKIELREDEGEPARLVGTLLPYGVQAQDRREVFEPGSLKWDAGGIMVSMSPTFAPKSHCQIHSGRGRRRA